MNLGQGAFIGNGYTKVQNGGVSDNFTLIKGAHQFSVGGHYLWTKTDSLQPAFAIGLYAFAEVSGGHFNPAITLGFVATRRITAPLAVAYWIAQFGGAVVAAAILRSLFTHQQFLGAVPNAPFIVLPGRRQPVR